MVLSVCTTPHIICSSYVLLKCGSLIIGQFTLVSILLTQGVGRVGWALGLKVLVLGSTECVPQFESCYLHFEKNFLGQRFTPLWAHQARTMISLWLKSLRKHCGKKKKKKKISDTQVPRDLLISKNLGSSTSCKTQLLKVSRNLKCYSITKTLFPIYIKKKN